MTSLIKRILKPVGLKMKGTSQSIGKEEDGGRVVGLCVCQLPSHYSKTRII